VCQNTQLESTLNSSSVSYRID